MSENVAKSQGAAKQEKPRAISRPSASVLLISPTNQVLLLCRVHTSSSFPSAHVFPGGNLSEQHDGEIPPPESPQRHDDGEAYRLAAIRETFEESGILLARNNGFGRLIEVEDDEREEGRKAVHKGDIDFKTWLARKGGRADTGGLIPFTRWVTPANVPKRFTTQMYLYFLPLATSTAADNTSALGPLSSPSDSEAVIPTPTPDGGIEHTAARFLPAPEWLDLARAGKVILFPPQFFLLHLVSKFLSPSAVNDDALRGRQRQALTEFANKDSIPPWSKKCISPVFLMQRQADGRLVLGLDKPGPELAGTDRKGDSERVVLVDFDRGGPRRIDIAHKKEIFEEQRRAQKL